MIDRTTLHSMNDYILHAAAHIRSNDYILIRNPPTTMFRSFLALSYWTSIIIGRLAGPESVLSTFKVVPLSDVEAVRPRLWRSQSTEDPPSSSSPAAFTHRTSGNRFNSLIPSSPLNASSLSPWDFFSTTYLQHSAYPAALRHTRGTLPSRVYQCCQSLLFQLS